METIHLPNFWLVLIALSSGLATFAVFRKILRRDGVIGFVRHVRERETVGEDIILFSLGLAFLCATLTIISAALELPFVDDDWFLDMRRQLTVLVYCILALYFLNGRLVRQLVRWLEHVR